MWTLAVIIAQTACAALLMAMPIVAIAAFTTLVTRRCRSADSASAHHETRDEPDGIVSALSPR